MNESQIDSMLENDPTTFIITYLIFSVIVFIMARNRNRNGGGYVVLSLLISPILTILLLWTLGVLQKKD